MDLQNFVTHTIVELIAGVVEAQKQVEPMKAWVAPYLDPELRKSGVPLDKGQRPVQTIRFEVALTTDSSRQTEGKIGVMLASVGIGGAKSGSSGEEHLTRISFEIPIAFPSQQETNALLASQQ